MRAAIAVIRPFHAALMARALRPHVEALTILSAAPRRFFGALPNDVDFRLVPAAAPVIERFLRLPKAFHRADLIAWDKLVAAMLPAAMLPASDVLLGFATQSLATGRKAKQRGAHFLLDRACPHVDFQQAIAREEAGRVGANFDAEPASFRERQLAEYALADVILVPSKFSARTFGPELQPKVRIAPLLGRLSAKPSGPRPSDAPFTVAVVGGNPLRKGFLYLLEAWQQLALPNARLLIRSSPDLTRYPRLTELVRAQPTVQLIPYVADIAAFYAAADVFCLPSVDDGFGMALCEALAHGVACVTTHNTGASELLTDGLDALIVDAQSSEQLAAALLRLYREPEQRRVLGEAGRATIERIEREELYARALVAAVSGGSSQTA